MVVIGGGDWREHKYKLYHKFIYI